MGNVNATVNPSGTVFYQVFDAFGTKMGGGTLMKCNPTSQRILASGRALWRGAEGSQTDCNGSDTEPRRRQLSKELTRDFWKILEILTNRFLVLVDMGS